MPEPIIRRRTPEEQLAYVQGWAAGANQALKLVAEHGIFPARDMLDSMRDTVIATLEVDDA